MLITLRSSQRFLFSFLVSGANERGTGDFGDICKSVPLYSDNITLVLLKFYLAWMAYYSKKLKVMERALWSQYFHFFTLEQFAFFSFLFTIVELRIHFSSLVYCNKSRKMRQDLVNRVLFLISRGVFLFNLVLI